MVINLHLINIIIKKFYSYRSLLINIDNIKKNARPTVSTYLFVLNDKQININLNFFTDLKINQKCIASYYL